VGGVGDSVKENKTVENIERIFQAAKQNGFEVFISPHYFYRRMGLEIQRTARDIGARDQDVRPQRVLSLDGFLGRVRLARAVQALYRGREDRRCQSPTGCGVRRPTISYCNCASAYQ